MFILAQGYVAFGQQSQLQVSVPNGVIQHGDVVHAHGDNLPGGWESGSPMTQNKEGKWTLSVPNRLKEYKYTIHRRDGSVVWESGVNRSFRDDSVVDIFRGLEGQILSYDVIINVELDLSSFQVSGFKPDSVKVFGSVYPLSWEFPTSGLAMSNFGNEDIWKRVWSINAGNTNDFSLKFAFKVQGVWHWEELPGHINHVALLGTDSREVRMHFGFDLDTNRIAIRKSDGVTVDDFSGLYSAYQDSRPYGYAFAVTLLESGQMEKAREVYVDYILHHNHLLDVIDDFDYLWAHQLADSGQLERALQFAAEKGAQETDSQRKAYFEYLQGELLTNAGEYERARVHLNQSIHLSEILEDRGQIVQGYALMALASGYINDEDRESIHLARRPLLKLASIHTDEQVQRAALLLLNTIAEMQRDDTLLRHTSERLATTGTPQQKFTHALTTAVQSYGRRGLDEVYAELVAMEETYSDEGQVERIRLTQVELLVSANELTRARAVFDTLPVSPSNRIHAHQKQDLMRRLHAN